MLVGARVGQAVHQQRHPGGAGHRPGQVEPAAPAGRLGQHERCGGGRQQADRHVYEQHPPPGQVGGQQAAGDHAHRRAAAAHRREHPHRPVTRRALGEGGDDQRQRGRRDQRAAGALDRPGGQQPRLGGGEAADQRGGREQHQPGDEHAASAEQVTGAAAEQQQPAESECIGVDHPLQAGPGEPERMLDVRQRHVHDRRVQHHHQLGGRDDDQGQAGLTAATGGRAAHPGPAGSHRLGSRHDILLGFTGAEAGLGAFLGAGAVWVFRSFQRQGAAAGRTLGYRVAAPERADARVEQVGEMAWPSGSRCPPSSNSTTPLHSRLHPCSGRRATGQAAVRSGASASGHQG